MKTFALITGLVVLSGTNTLAANFNPMDSGRHNLEVCTLRRCNTTQAGSINADIFNTGLTHNYRLKTVNLKENRRVILAEYAPPDIGSPDTRGRSGSR